MIFDDRERNGLQVYRRKIDAVGLPADDFIEWLSSREIKRLETIASSNRRKTWLAGRALVKTMARRFFPETTPRELEVISTDANGRGVSPYIEFAGRRCPLTLSISHTDREIAVAMTNEVGYVVGIDLVDLRNPEDRFAKIRNVWLTERERSQVPPFDHREIARRWALKEAAYKSMRHTRTGFAPLHYEILRDETQPETWHIACPGGTLIRHEEITIFESRDGLSALVRRQTLALS